MWDTILRTAALAVFTYFLTLILCRLMGRKVISQMTFFDFVVGIIVGSVAANLVVNVKNPVITATTSLITLTFLTVVVDYAHIKSFLSRKIINSEPVSLIENGKIVDANMRRTRFSLDALTMLLREKNVFNISEVEFAILETDGKLSVLKKSQYLPVTPADLKVPTPYKGLTRDVVIDGSIMEENLEDVNLNRQWLLNKLKDYGVTNVKEVFYAGLDTSGNLYVSKKQNSHETEGKYGIE